MSGRGAPGPTIVAVSGACGRTRPGVDFGAQIYDLRDFARGGSKP